MAYACWYLVLLFSVAWFFQVMIVVFSLALHFFECHGVFGFDLDFELCNSRMDFGIWGGDGLEKNSQRPRNHLISFCEIHGKS